MKLAMYKKDDKEVMIEVWENYEGMWIADRYASTQDWISQNEQYIAKAPTRRSLGFKLMGLGYEWVSDIGN